MQATCKAPKRANLAQTHATRSALERFYFTVSITLFGPIQKVADLSNLGKRWLEFFSALNRGGEIGYKGTAATIPDLTKAEYRAKGQTCSDRTTHRALAELIQKGYLTKETPRLGKWRQYGIEEDHGKRDILCIYTLTNKALAVWEKPKSKPELKIVPNDPKAENLHKPTTAKVAEVRSFECSNNPPASDYIEQPPAPVRVIELLENSQEKKIGKRNKTRINISRQIEKKSNPAKVRSLRQNLLLKTIRLVLLDEKSRKTAAAALTLAKREIDQPLDRQTPIEWDYWLKVWPDYDEQFNRIPTAQRLIVPLLIDAVKGVDFGNNALSEVIAAAGMAKKEPSPAEVIAAELAKAKERLDEYVKIGSLTVESAAQMLASQKALLWQKQNMGIL